MGALGSGAIDVAMVLTSGATPYAQWWSSGIHDVPRDHLTQELLADLDTMMDSGDPFDRRRRLQLPARGGRIRHGDGIRMAGHVGPERRQRHGVDRVDGHLPHLLDGVGRRAA